MGKMIIITPEQQLLLDHFKLDSSLPSRFYFSGGTALSLYYLQHRESVDLDFFSEKEFAPQEILEKVTSWAEKHQCTVEYVPLAQTHVFNITFPNNKTVKVDFVFYPYKSVGESQVIDGISIDSELDIAVNKLLVAEQRAEVKDFVDLYFLLQKFTVWDLIEGVRQKFKVSLDPFIVGSDFFKVEGFDYLPKMLKTLTLDELKSFFKQKSKEIGTKSVE